MSEIENLCSDTVDRILIVDDQTFNIEALNIILKLVFHLDVDKICDKAFNGMEAIDRVMDDVKMNQSKGRNMSSYKVIFMDCSMPMMDGY